jgi:hypothetical protein
MIIPHYWAESRLQIKAPSRQVTVRRWGWSDVSQEEAQALAEQRASAAMDRIVNGEDLLRRESKEAYGSADGVPIREEVVSRHGESAITRNSYGSLCLNTPNVLFADVDASWLPVSSLSLPGCLLLAAPGILSGVWQKSFLIGLVIAIGLPWLWSIIIGWLNTRRRPAAEAQAKQEALTSIHAFSASHPEWHLRVYETPAGFRLLAMHDVFDPQGDATKAALNALNSDKRFTSLCVLQNCFRARVSPKFWRMGYRPKAQLPKSKWPFPPEHIPRRKAWVDGYNAISWKFASCRFKERLGSSATHPAAEAVRSLHDEMCRTNSDLPLA